MPARELTASSTKPEPELSRKSWLSLKSSRKHHRPPPFPSTPKRQYDDDEDTKVAHTEEKEVACPPKCFLETQCGIREDGEQFIIGNSPVFIDPDDKITIKGTIFRGTERLWDLLTRKNVNTQIVGKEDLKTYKNNRKLTNVHFTRYQPGDYLNIIEERNLPLSLRPFSRNRRERASNQGYVVSG